MIESWVRMPRDTRAGVRLFCFAHAGGGSTLFLPWRARFGDDIAVCPVVLPGREARIIEPPYRRMDELIPPLVAALRRHSGSGYALFGHSLGAAIAYEVARRLPETGVEPPAHLFVSARRAPDVPASPGLHDLPEERFLTVVQRLGGVPERAVRRRDWLDRFLPCLRADFEINDTYLAVPGAPLPCPVSAMAGAADPAVTPTEMRGWKRTTSGTFRLRVFPGDHFYLKPAPPGFVAAIREDLRDISSLVR